MNTEEALEAAYIALLKQDIVPDAVFISTNKFSEINNRQVLTMTVYHSDLFGNDDFMMSHLGLFRDVVDFYANPDGSLDHKVASKIKQSFGKC